MFVRKASWTLLFCSEMQFASSGNDAYVRKMKCFHVRGAPHLLHHQRRRCLCMGIWMRVTFNFDLALSWVEWSGVIIILFFTFVAGFPDELRTVPTRFRFSSPSVGRSRSGCEHGQQVQVTPRWQHVARTTSLELRPEASRWLQRTGWTTDREVQRGSRIEQRAYEMDGRNRDSQRIHGSLFSQYSTNESSLWTREGNDVNELCCSLVTTQEYRFCHIIETN